jgi:glycosyltransferase involved in cell wall biosynthesis
METAANIDLFLASAHFFPTHGGAQLRYLRYIPGLSERGIKTQVLTGTPKRKKHIPETGAVQGEHLAPEIREDIPIHRIPLPEKAGWLRSIAFNQAVLRFCRQSGYRPQVIQLVSSLQPRSIFWLNRFKKLDTALVYAFTLPIKWPANPIKRAIRRRTLRYLYRQMDCIIVNSRQMQSQMLELGVDSRMEFIPNGVDHRRFSAPRGPAEVREARLALGIAPEQTVVTTVGAVHPRKGSDLLIKAWGRIARSHPEAHLYIVGLRKDLSYPKLGAFQQRVEDLVTNSGAADRIHFTGLVRNVETYLRASDIFVFPSQREGMPNVVLEAMASKLPVVLTPFIGLSEEFGQAGREYLLVERNAEGLANTMALLLRDKNLRTKLGENAHTWTRTYLDIDLSLDRYAALYRELASIHAEKRA